jgi:archaemetzincin
MFMFAAVAFAAENADAQRLKKITDVQAALAPEQCRGYERLGTPKSGEWLAIENEVPESLEDYAAKARVYPTLKRYTLVLQPLGKFSRSETRLLTILKDYAEVFFQLPARVAPPLELKLADKNSRLARTISIDRFRRQTEFDGDIVLDEILEKKLPEDAVICVGITAEPLFSGHQRILGLASLDKRVAVCSLFRSLQSVRRDAADDPQTIRRLCRLFSHEVAHSFGLGHCVFFRCAMNGCNNLAEADTTPMHLCPVCSQKLCLNNEIDFKKRDASLEKFYRLNHLDPEAAWMAAHRRHE